MGTQGRKTLRLEQHENDPMLEVNQQSCANVEGQMDELVPSDSELPLCIEQHLSRYLPETISGHRFLEPRGDPGTYKVVSYDGRAVQYRITPTIEDRDKYNVASDGDIVRGQLSDGWLTIDAVFKIPSLKMSGLHLASLDKFNPDDADFNQCSHRSNSQRD